MRWEANARQTFREKYYYRNVGYIKKIRQVSYQDILGNNRLFHRSLKPSIKVRRGRKKEEEEEEEVGEEEEEERKKERKKRWGKRDKKEKESQNKLPEI